MSISFYAIAGVKLNGKFRVGLGVKGQGTSKRIPALKSVQEIIMVGRDCILIRVINRKPSG
jgi:hypothetical protein